MIDMFLYNWQIREDWFDFCKNISEEDLTKKRVGGFGSFLHNLFHVIDCEQIWINQLKGTQVLVKDFNSISNLEEVIEFSNTTKSQTLIYLQSYNNDMGKRVLEVNSVTVKHIIFLMKKYSNISLHMRFTILDNYQYGQEKLAKNPSHPIFYLGKSNRSKPLLRYLSRGFYLLY